MWRQWKGMPLTVFPARYIEMNMPAPSPQLSSCTANKRVALSLLNEYLMEMCTQFNLTLLGSQSLENARDNIHITISEGTEERVSNSSW